MFKGKSLKELYQMEYLSNLKNMYGACMDLFFYHAGCFISFQARLHYQWPPMVLEHTTHLNLVMVVKNFRHHQPS